MVDLFSPAPVIVLGSSYRILPLARDPPLPIYGIFPPPFCVSSIVILLSLLLVLPYTHHAPPPPTPRHHVHPADQPPDPSFSAVPPPH
jgi:hypothetical protein